MIKRILHSSRTEPGEFSFVYRQTLYKNDVPIVFGPNTDGRLESARDEQAVWLCRNGRPEMYASQIHVIPGLLFALSGYK